MQNWELRAEKALSWEPRHCGEAGDVFTEQACELVELAWTKREWR